MTKVKCTNRVYQAILARKLTQGEVARKLGWQRTQLNTIIKGHKQPQIASALQIAAVLGVPVDKLFFLPADTRRKLVARR